MVKEIPIPKRGIAMNLIDAITLSLKTAVENALFPFVVMKILK